MSWGSSTKLLQRAHPSSHFLVGAGCPVAARCYHEHHPRILSTLLHDRKGSGDENESREKHEHGERGIDHMRSNK